MNCLYMIHAYDNVVHTSLSLWSNCGNLALVPGNAPFLDSSSNNFLHLSTNCTILQEKNEMNHACSI